MNDTQQPMSAREFKFGDLIPKPIYGRQYIFVRYMPHIDPPAIELICDKPECLWMTEEELAPYLEPSAQPHVAAGSGWKERMLKAIYDQCCAYDGGGYEAAVKAIDALLDEVCELPPIPETFTVPNGGKSLAEVFGPEYAEQMAAACLRDAALIRAATSSDPSA